jgi:hypothetical protein
MSMTGLETYLERVAHRNNLSLRQKTPTRLFYIGNRKPIAIEITTGIIDPDMCDIPGMTQVVVVFVNETLFYGFIHGYEYQWLEKLFDVVCRFGGRKRVDLSGMNMGTDIESFIDKFQQQ